MQFSKLWITAVVVFLAGLAKTYLNYDIGDAGTNAVIEFVTLFIAPGVAAWLSKHKDSPAIKTAEQILASLPIQPVVPQTQPTQQVQQVVQQAVQQAAQQQVATPIPADQTAQPAQPAGQTAPPASTVPPTQQ